jgi:hypothetical protein
LASLVFVFIEAVYFRSCKIKKWETIIGPTERTDLIFQNSKYNPVPVETVPFKSA